VGTVPNGTFGRMSNRRSSITMTPDEVAAYLEEQRVLNVATIGPTGHPHVVAMWYVMLDGAPAFWTFGKSQKVLNLRRDPKITGLVESGETYEQLRGVELVGTARLIEDYEVVRDIGIRVSTKYSGPPSDAALPFIEAQARKRIGVVIDVERVVSWDHTKLGGAY
jgi:general stress protein 26